ncbi:hypothetical protein ACFVFH_06140 [Streptomyces sp. NPDC057697]|uniref:hypothetical protein n=1 Tax=Streptomyces sp. NPDC057697 TaxID=3346219 RepID=UPI00369A1FCA
MNTGRRVALAASTIALSLGGVAATAGPAAAVDTGNCSSIHKTCMVFYYNSNYGGSAFIASGDIPNLGDFNFTTAGAGKGLKVKNQAASAKFRAHNSSQVSYGAIFFNSGYAGPCDLFGGMENSVASAPKLAKTYNNNASLRFYPYVLPKLPSGCKSWW